MSHLLRTLHHHLPLSVQGVRRLRPPKLPPAMATSLGHTTLRDLRVPPSTTLPRTGMHGRRDVPPQIYPPLCHDSPPAISIPLHRRGRIRRQLLEYMTTVGLCSVGALLSFPLFNPEYTGNMFIL